MQVIPATLTGPVWFNQKNPSKQDKLRIVWLQQYKGFIGNILACFVYLANSLLHFWLVDDTDTIWEQSALLFSGGYKSCLIQNDCELCELLVFGWRTKEFQQHFRKDWEILLWVGFPLFHVEFFTDSNKNFIPSIPSTFPKPPNKTGLNDNYLWGFLHTVVK